MLKKFLVSSLAIACCVSLIGCGSIAKKKKAEDNAKPVTQSTQVANAEDELSTRLDVDIYIDGTYSMSGYVKGNANTAYINAVKTMESTIKSNWKEESVTFVKFGDSNKTLKREEFLAFEKVDFYQEKDTSLQKVVNGIKDDKLSIIVTDLFQTNQDIESVGYALKEKVFTKAGKAIAIVGIKSQFEGVIYDIGRNLNSQEYKTTADPGSFRPFYMMLIGKEKDVKALATAFEKNVPGSKKVVISRNLGEIGKLEGLKVGSNPEKLAIMSRMETIQEKLNLKLKTGEKQSITNVNVNVKNLVMEVPKNYTLALERLEQLVPEKTKGEKTGALDKVTGMLSGDKKKAKLVLEPVNYKSNFLNGKVEFDQFGSEANLKLALKFAPAGIDKKAGQYKLTMGMLPSREEYLQSINKSFEAWNFSDDRVPSPIEVGTKTQNINKFVGWLGDVNYNVNKPGFHNAVMFVKAE